MIWDEREHIKTCGHAWTSLDERPDASDRRRIFEACSDTWLALVHRGRATRIFKTDPVTFVREGGIYQPDLMPDDATPLMASFLMALPDTPFSLEEARSIHTPAKRLLYRALDQGWVDHLAHDAWVKSLS